MTRRIEVLLGDVERLKAQLLASGVLSDESRVETQLVKAVDELAFIVRGQFDEIDKLKARLRQLEGKQKRTARR
jgi:uncharacterized small protein (DUF1192 family)